MAGILQTKEMVEVMLSLMTEHSGTIPITTVTETIRFRLIKEMLAPMSMVQVIKIDSGAQMATMMAIQMTVTLFLPIKRNGLIQIMMDMEIITTLTSNQLLNGISIKEGINSQ